nr:MULTISPECIES: sigma-70 family RNA polymerase sigma factor [unclassified Marinomonas]
MFQHGKLLKAFVNKNVWDENDVEDIYQITLFEAFKSYKNFRYESQPKTWLCGVASKVISNYVRKKLKSRLEFTADMIPLLESEITVNLDGESISYRDPEASYEYMQLAKSLNRSYEKLPKEIRDVFNSAIEIGNSYQKTSELYNIPIGTVRSRISRAREIMRDSYFK